MFNRRSGVDAILMEQYFIEKSRNLGPLMGLSDEQVTLWSAIGQSRSSSELLGQLVIGEPKTQRELETSLVGGTSVSIRIRVGRRGVGRVRPARRR